jgi:hypothetical protein
MWPLQDSTSRCFPDRHGMHRPAERGAVIAPGSAPDTDSPLGTDEHQPGDAKFTTGVVRSLNSTFLPTRSIPSCNQRPA